MEAVLAVAEDEEEAEEGTMIAECLVGAVALIAAVCVLRACRV